MSSTIRNTLLVVCTIWQRHVYSASYNNYPLMCLSYGPLRSVAIRIVITIRYLRVSIGDSYRPNQDNKKVYIHKNIDDTINMREEIK